MAIGILNRITQLQGSHPLTQFCFDVGLNYEKLKKAFQRPTLPDVETLLKISRHFHIDLSWLISGEPESSPVHFRIGQRLTSFRKRRNWSTQQFAEFTGLTIPVLTWYEAGSGAIALEFVAELGDRLGLTFSELCGPPADGSVPPELKVFSPENLQGTPALRNEDYVSIPLTSSSIAAGQPIIQEENIEDYVLLHIRAAGKRTDLVASRVDGDSMEPVLHSGDIVVIDRQDRAVAKNKMYAVFYEEGLTAKYLEQQEGWLILRPVNPNAQVQIVNLQEQDNPIVGRIIGAWKEL